MPDWVNSFVAFLKIHPAHKEKVPEKDVDYERNLLIMADYL